MVLKIKPHTGIHYPSNVSLSFDAVHISCSGKSDWQLITEPLNGFFGFFWSSLNKHKGLWRKTDDSVSHSNLSPSPEIQLLLAAEIEVLRGRQGEEEQHGHKNLISHQESLSTTLLGPEIKDRYTGQRPRQKATSLPSAATELCCTNHVSISLFRSSTSENAKILTKIRLVHPGFWLGEGNICGVDFRIL